MADIIDIIYDRTGLKFRRTEKTYPDGTKKYIIYLIYFIGDRKWDEKHMFIIQEEGITQTKLDKIVDELNTIKSKPLFTYL